MSIPKDRLSKVLKIIFMIFIVFYLLTNTFWSSEYGDFSAVRDESFTKEPIDQVIVSTEAIYVCYADNRIVNAYDLNGCFLWCVKGPSLRNCKFQLLDGFLILYNYKSDPAYTYDAVTGQYMGAPIAETLGLSFQYPDKPTPIEYLSSEEIGWDNYNVYRMEDGSAVKLVSRSWWYILFHPLLVWAIGFSAGMLIFILHVIRQFRQSAEMDMHSLSPEDRRIAVFYKVFSVIGGANILLNILIIPFYPTYILSSFVLVVVFVLSCIVLTLFAGIRHGFLYASVAEEDPIVKKWTLAAFLAIILSMLSAVAILMLKN